jgi:hypothetical protein
MNRRFAATVAATLATMVCALRTVHSFTLGPDGGYPLSGLTVASTAAKLYGTATSGGAAGNGTANFCSACP